MKSQSELLEADLDKTKITLGVAAATFAFLFVQGGIAIWWAASMSADMRNVKDLLAISATANKKDIDSLETRIVDNTTSIKKFEDDKFQMRLDLDSLKQQILSLKEKK